MKRYTLTDDWSASDLSQVDPAMLEQVRDESLTLEQRSELLTAIREAAVVEITAEEREELDALHAAVKPEVPTGKVYTVIALDAHRNKSGVLTGILNCRIDGEHVQVRF